VVWFGEALPEGCLESASAAAQAAPLVLVIGTSSLVMPAAHLPILALGAGATVVEINPDPTPISAEVHDCVRGPAGKVVPELLAAAFGPPPREPGS
jgi:NAD-dependent deacetylase